MSLVELSRDDVCSTAQTPAKKESTVRSTFAPRQLATALETTLAGLPLDLSEPMLIKPTADLTTQISGLTGCLLLDVAPSRTWQTSARAFIEVRDATVRHAIALGSVPLTTTSDDPNVSDLVRLLSFVGKGVLASRLDDLRSVRDEEVADGDVEPMCRESVRSFVWFNIDGLAAGSAQLSLTPAGCVFATWHFGPKDRVSLHFVAESDVRLLDVRPDDDAPGGVCRTVRSGSDFFVRSYLQRERPELLTPDE